MEHSGFFDGDEEYGQDEFNRYFDNIFESGVSIDSSNVMTLGVSNNVTTLNIATGFAIIKGFYLYNDSIKSIAITANTNYDRIDRVVVRLNLSTSKVSIELKSGVAGSTPTVPSLQRDNNVYELSLAQVKITKAGVITIKDERYDKTFCGAIRPKNLTEFNTMIAGLQSRFNTWFSSLQGKATRNIYIQAITPTGDTEGDIWIQTV